MFEWVFDYSLYVNNFVPIVSAPRAVYNMPLIYVCFSGFELCPFHQKVIFVIFDERELHYWWKRGGFMTFLRNFYTQGEKYYFHMKGASEMRLIPRVVRLRGTSKWTSQVEEGYPNLSQSDGGRGPDRDGDGQMGARRGRWEKEDRWEEQGTRLGICLGQMGEQGPNGGQRAHMGKQGVRWSRGQMGRSRDSIETILTSHQSGILHSLMLSLLWNTSSKEDK